MRLQNDFINADIGQHRYRVEVSQIYNTATVAQSPLPRRSDVVIFSAEWARGKGSAGRKSVIKAKCCVRQSGRWFPNLIEITRTYYAHDDSSRLPHRLMCTIDCDQNQLDGSLDGDSETHTNRAQLNGSRFYAMRNYYCAAICITCIVTRCWTKCFLPDIPSGNRLKCLQIQQNTPATHTICFIVIYLQRIYI